ncbi:MAG: hypothetical protein AAFO29_18335, partial [Actinomycetota bacterium]
MRQRLVTLLVSALLVAVVGLASSPTSASAQTDGLAELWPELTDEERMWAWSFATLQTSQDSPSVTAVAPGAGPFDSAGPGIVAMSRIDVAGQPFEASGWETIGPRGSTWYPPATTDFYAVGSDLVLTHLVFDDVVDVCGSGQVEVALFEDVAGTTRFPGLEGFTTPDLTSTRADAHLCRGGENLWLYFTGDQPGQPFSAAHGAILTSGPVPGITGDRQQLIVLSENPTSTLLPTITVADNPADPATYRWRQWTAPETKAVDLSMPPEVAPDLETAILATLGREVPAPAADPEEPTDDAEAGADDQPAENDATEANSDDPESAAETDADPAAADPDDGDELEATEIDNTTAIVDQPDDGGNGLLIGLLGAILAAVPLGFLFRRFLTGRGRPGASSGDPSGTTPGRPAGRSYNDHPMPDRHVPARDSFLNDMVNRALEQGRQPDGDRIIELTREDELAARGELLGGEGLMPWTD